MFVRFGGALGDGPKAAPARGRLRARVSERAGSVAVLVLLQCAGAGAAAVAVAVEFVVVGVPARVPRLNVVCFNSVVDVTVLGLVGGAPGGVF